MYMCTHLAAPKGFIHTEAFLFASPPTERGDVDAWARQTLRREPDAGSPATAEMEAAGWSSEVMGGSPVVMSSSWF